MLKEIYNEGGWELVHSFFQDHVAEAMKWDDETKKGWIKNYKRGLITVEDAFPREEWEEAHRMIDSWHF